MYFAFIIANYKLYIFIHLSIIYNIEIYITKFILLCIAVLIYTIYLYLTSYNISLYTLLDFREIGVFNTRELAIFLCFIFFILSIKDRGIIYSFKQLLKHFFVKKLVLVYILMLFYIILIIILLYRINFWEISFLKDTIVWFLFSGFITVFSLKNAEKDKKYFKKILIENIKLSAIIQFVIGLYTFNIFFEILLVSSSFMIGGLLAFASGERYSRVRYFINTISILIGLSVIYYSFNKLLTDKELDVIKYLKQFALPIIFTMWFVPFFYILHLYMIYESIFISLRVAIKSNSLLNYSKKKAILTFWGDIALLRRWMRRILIEEPKSKVEIDKLTSDILNLKRLEENPVTIESDIGWSPYKAKNFLNSKGISTGYYDKAFDDEWQAISPYIDLDSELDLTNGNVNSSNNVAYYVSGNNHIAKQLKLVLNINSMKNEKTSLNKYLELANLLFNSACYKNLPNQITQSILKKKNKDMSIKNLNISIKKNDYVKKDMGYSIVFSIFYK